MKDTQLQIRVTRSQKSAIKRAAARAGQDISAWVLSRCLNKEQERFESLLKKLRSNPTSFALAEFNDFLNRLPANEFEHALQTSFGISLESELSNRVAAMIEYAAFLKNASPPAWTKNIPPLREPVFDTQLQSLRLHLLLNAPASFKRRNIFVDASIGDRV